MNWREHMQARLLELQPASIYALDEPARQLALMALPDTPVSMVDGQPAYSCALALGITALDKLDIQQARHLISQTRLYAASRMLLAVQSKAALDDDLFRGLGFTLSLADPAENVRVYHYDLDTYKTVPDWLNARFWAHPERWKP